jgi:hypothetical protein
MRGKLQPPVGLRETADRTSFQIEVNIVYTFVGCGHNISRPQNIFKAVALSAAFISEN